MISFEEWQAMYAEIIAILKKTKSKNKSPPISKKIDNLFQELTDVIYDYHAIEFDAIQARFNVIDKIIFILEKVCAKNSIKNNENIMRILNAIKESGITDKINLLPFIIYDLIDTNQIDEAKQVLHSAFVNNYKTPITQWLIFFCCDNKYMREETCLCTIQLLHEINADFNSYNNDNETPLIAAAIRNDKISIIQALVAAGASIHQGKKNFSARNPLYFSAVKIKLNFVEFFLNAGADAKILIDNDETVMHILVSQRLTSDDNLQIIKLLYAAGMPIQSPTILTYAIKARNLNVIDLLLSLGASLYDGIALDVIKMNDAELLMHLSNKYNIALPRDIPKGCRLEMFQFCLAKNMSLNAYSLSDVVVLQTPEATCYCIDRDKNLIIQFDFIPCKLFSSIPGKCSLAHFAAAFATRDSLSFLITAGLDINACNQNGLSTLHYATVYNNTEALKILIFAGVDVNATDTQGKTALHWAVEDGMAMSTDHIPCAKILLYAGAEPTIKDKLGKKPLEYLYQAGPYADERIKAWNEAFKVTRRLASSMKSNSKEVASLSQLTTLFIANSKRHTRRLAYRKKIPLELSVNIEDVACELLTPPKM